MSREEAAAKAIHEAEISGPRAGAPLDRLAEAALAAADAHDAANGVHRVSLDQPTVEKAARELLWRFSELGRNPAVAMDAVRAIVRTAAVKEGQ